MPIAWERINYDDLNARQKERYNFHKSAAILIDYGFNCIKLDDDWEGADFLACHKDGWTLKVQLKGRGVIIDKKYQTKGLWMNFQVGGTWYLVPHDRLVKLAGKHTNWLNTKSWKEDGHYFSRDPSKDLRAALRKFAVGREGA